MVFTTYAQSPALCTPTLNPPTGGVLSVTDPKWIGVSSDPPFTLSGAPISAAPTKPPNEIVGYCPGLDDTLRPLRKDVSLDTSGLIKNADLNSGTTLRITNEDVSFKLKFIALHKDIWSDNATDSQVSLFFTGVARDGSTVYTHICIPVRYTSDDLNNNLFLKSWLKGVTPPSGLTVNNLLDAKNGLKFQVMYYCLGNKSKWNSYNLFLSSEPLLLNGTGLPTWLANDRALSGSQWTDTSSYLLKTFSDMYTYVMNVRHPFHTDFLNWDRIEITDNTKIFVPILNGSKPQSGITPSYYVLPAGSLSGTAFKQPGTRTIPKKQIKCYPINLMKDVDDKGDVIVNSNNVPLTTTGLMNEKSKEMMDIKLDPSAVQAQNYTFVFISSIFIAIIALVFILGVIFWFFGGKQSPTETVMAAAAAAAAVTLPDPLPPPPGLAATLPDPLPPPPGLAATLPDPLPTPPGATP